MKALPYKTLCRLIGKAWAEEIPREEIETVYVLGSYDGPGSGLVRYQPPGETTKRWFLAECLEMNTTDTRVYWVIEWPDDKVQAAIQHIEAHHLAFGGSKCTWDGKRAGPHRVGSLGAYSSPGYNQRSDEWHKAHRPPGRSPSDEAVVLGYFYGWEYDGD